MAAAKHGRSGPHGTILRAGSKDGPQLQRSKGKRWTEEAEAAFLDALAASCNVKHAAAAAGFSAEAIYRRRRFHPDFADRWRAALDQGYVRIEMMLVDRAEQALAGFAPDPDTPIPTMTVADALNVLKLHRDSARGGEARRPGWRGRPRSLDEVRDSILLKLEAIEVQRLAAASEDGG